MLEAFIDDFFALVVQQEGNDRVDPMAAAMLDGVYQLFGPPRPDVPGCVDSAKAQPWASMHEILGVMVDLNRLALSLPRPRRSRSSCCSF